MRKKPASVDLSFDIAPAAALPRPATATQRALDSARHTNAADAAEAERRAFADTEPVFMDTVPPSDN